MANSQKLVDKQQLVDKSHQTTVSKFEPDKITDFECACLECSSHGAFHFVVLCSVVFSSSSSLLHSVLWLQQNKLSSSLDCQFKKRGTIEVCIYTGMHVHACVYVCALLYVHARVRPWTVYACIYVYVYMYGFVYIYTRICCNTAVCICVCRSVVYATTLLSTYVYFCERAHGFICAHGLGPPCGGFKT